MTEIAAKGIAWKTVGLWVLRVLVALPFLMGAAMKLTSQPMMVEEFGVIGLGTWFLYFTGVVELIGALAVLTPPISVFGALLLLCVDIGAFLAQLFPLHGDVVHTIIIGVLIAALIYLQRRQILSRLGK